MKYDDRKLVVSIALITCLGLASLLIDSQLASFIRDFRGLDILIGFNELIINLLTGLSELIIGLIVLFIPISFLWIKDKKKWIKSLSLAVISAAILSILLQIIFGRMRPEGALIPIGEILPIEMLGYYSFPSGHTAIIASVLPVIEKTLTKLNKLKWFWIFVILIVALKRIYLGVHFLSDVIFGALIGYLIGWIIVNRGWIKWRIWKYGDRHSTQP